MITRNTSNATTTTATFHVAESPVPIQVAEVRAERGLQWRVRLTFVGPNRANASGRSSKWWEASSPGGPGAQATVRWGATGATGQAQHNVDPRKALVRAWGKAAKGYRVDEGVRSATMSRPAYESAAGVVRNGHGARPSTPLTLQERVNRATWRTATTEQLYMIAGEHGWIPVDLDVVAVLVGPALPRDGAPVRPFVGDDGRLWGAVLVADNDRMNAYAVL